MNTRATEALPREAADLGFASRSHWPFHLGAAADVLLGLDLLVAATLAFCWLDASRKTLWAIVMLNEAWILGSAVLVVFAHHLLSGFGNGIVLGLAAVLAGLTWFQARALRRDA